MATKRKPDIRGTRTKHICQKEEIIRRLSELSVGNGDPEKGFAFKMVKMADDQKLLTKDISEIKDTVKNIEVLYADTKQLVNDTASALDQYKSEMANYKKGEEDAEAKALIAKNLLAQQKRDNAFKVFQILGITLTIIGLVVTVLLSQRNNAKTDEANKRVEQLGSPVVVNPRGEMIPLPKGYELKMFPKDFNGDTTQKK